MTTNDFHCHHMPALIINNNYLFLVNIIIIIDAVIPTVQVMCKKKEYIYNVNSSPHQADVAV